jgi:hypothetical protein
MPKALYKKNYSKLKWKQSLTTITKIINLDLLVSFLMSFSIVFAGN